MSASPASIGVFSIWLSVSFIALLSIQTDTTTRCLSLCFGMYTYLKTSQSKLPSKQLLGPSQSKYANRDEKKNKKTTQKKWAGFRFGSIHSEPNQTKMRGTATVIEEQVCRSFGDYLNHLNHFNHNNRGGVAALINSPGKKKTLCLCCLHSGDKTALYDLCYLQGFDS